MKSRASIILKQILSALSTLVKSKSMTLKSKTSAMRTRIMIYSLLRNKKVLMGSISHKFQSMVSHLVKHDEEKDKDIDESKAIVLYNAMQNELSPSPSRYGLMELEYGCYDGEDSDKYPDLTHSLFDSDGDEGLGNGSVIDMVRNSKEDGEDFRLEDEIDHVADLFIRKFRRQMRLEKQESFKNYQEMLQRGV